MPTPSIQDPIPPLATSHRPTHATCPPEDERHAETIVDNQSIAHTSAGSDEVLMAPSAPPEPIMRALGGRGIILSPHQDNDGDLEMGRDSPSISDSGDDSKTETLGILSEHASGSAPAPIPVTLQRPQTPNPQVRHSRGIQRCVILTHKQQQFTPRYTSSFLRNGSKFTGTQQSDRQVYNVQVEIKHVDMNESFICGYLRIEGLTSEHPTLTTYFEGEIIGTKYTFHTRHAEWGSSEKVDMHHWNRFPAWKPLARQARRPDFNFRDYASRDTLFMRWKEYFLVPDHRVRTISGASFEGFYYICFNQVNGNVSGIYFHSKSEKYQQLELCHVDDRGCMGALEFR